MDSLRCYAEYRCYDGPRTANGCAAAVYQLWRVEFGDSNGGCWVGFVGIQAGIPNYAAEP